MLNALLLQRQISRTMKKEKTGTGKAEEKVINAYNKIENTVVDAYDRMEETVVNAYHKIENKFVETFFENDKEE